MRLGNGVFSLSFPPPRVSYDVSSLVFLRVHGAHGYTRPRHRTRRMTATDRLPRRLRICQRRQTEKKKKKKNHSTKNALCTFEIVSLSPKPFLPFFFRFFLLETPFRCIFPIVDSIEETTTGMHIRLAALFLSFFRRRRVSNTLVYTVKTVGEAIAFPSFDSTIDSKSESQFWPIPAHGEITFHFFSLAICFQFQECRGRIKTIGWFS